MTKKLVFITYRDFPAVGYDLLKEKFEIVLWNSITKPTKEQLIRNVKGKFAIICSPRTPIDGEIIESAGDSLKVVSTFSAGWDHLDIEKLKSKKIRIGNALDAATPAVAEYAVSLLLATGRRIIEGHMAASKGDWAFRKMNALSIIGRGLYQSTVAVVGCGRIGVSIVRKLKPFDPKIIFYYARSKKPEADQLGAELQSLDFIMKESDFIIVVLELNAETSGIINRDRINSMKSNAILVNVGRGGLIDEEALIEALQNKKISGAGLDVFATEPLPVDSPLTKMDNVVLSPHAAWNLDITVNSMAELAALNVLAVLNGTEMPAEIL